MAYLMDVALDNCRRLRRKSYLFDYKGVRFKLIQDNPRKWSDHLLTILPQNDGTLEDRTFRMAAEFASALNWANGGPVSVHYAGGISWPDEFSLQEAGPSIRVFPTICNVEIIRSYDLYRIPHIRTQAQREALALFREARASNNVYLSFLFYWQVLEVNGGDAVGFINKTLRRHRQHLRFSQDDFSSLPLAGRSLGVYLLDDCRHAIAHIRRKPGKRKIEIDQLEERVRIVYSTRVIEAFARFYITDVLGLNEKLYLVRRSRRDFPNFTDQGSGFPLAYPRLRWRGPSRRLRRVFE